MDKEYSDKRVWAVGLIIKCPFNEPLDNCPLRDIRKLPLEERIELVDNMPEEKLNTIVDYHKNCLAQREAT